MKRILNNGKLVWPKRTRCSARQRESVLLAGRRAILAVSLIGFLWHPVGAVNIHQDSSVSRPRIGLVLSGGGAKGFAHIGTLKLLDSLGIPVDYIAGTSMGGIIGGLYAIGYSGKEIEAIARRTDWEEMFSDTPAREELPFFEKTTSGRFALSLYLKGFLPALPTGLIKGQKAFQLLSRLTYAYQNVRNFDELPIPFRCVAVDLVRGREVVLDHGSLALALRATMSIPTVFTPVPWGDSLLVDGFILNNIPVDVVKAMGADYVITVNVGTLLLDRSRLNSLFDVMNQTLNIAGYQKEMEALSQSDVLIQPDLESFSSTSFSSQDIARIIQRGIQEARAHVDACMALKRRFHVSRDSLSGAASAHVIRFHGITLAGNTTLPVQFVADLFGLQPGQECTRADLDSCVGLLTHSGFFKNVKYELRPADSSSVRVILYLEEHRPPTISRVDIKGLNHLPVALVHELLDVHSGERFDPDVIDKKITRLYGLGYFETIYYEIEPLDERQIRLTFHFKENPRRELNVGLDYNDHFQFTGRLQLVSTSSLIPGMRSTLSAMFGGYTRLKASLVYLTRTLSFPVYPFAEYRYQNIQRSLYNDREQSIGHFVDRSHRLGAGIGFLFGNRANLVLSYFQEFMDVGVPSAAGPPDLVTHAGAALRGLQADLTFDTLDDLAFTTRGVLVKSAYQYITTRLNASVGYKRWHLSATMFFPTGLQRLIGKLHLFYGHSSQSTPFYRWFFSGGPDSFAGARYFALAVPSLLKAEVEIKRKVWKKMYVTGLISATHSRWLPGQSKKTDPYTLAAVGARAGVLSPIGPIQVTAAFRFNRVARWPNHAVFLFLTIGTHLTD